MMLIFRLSGDVFALPVGEVHEILDPMPVTPVPGAPAFAPALINVRGAIAPLIDIRQRLRMPAVPPDDNARIIVLELPLNGAPTRLAIMADAVEEVIETDRAALKPVPELGARWPEQYVTGVARHGEALVILLDTETLFRPDAGPSLQA
ncbi:MAG: chemotaxis protein CheW [Pseudotabrizicola sp.]|uniref:chemotaxis protein CheW n=1 Tax=Pseudotabrizicola sp. TaxID=2939647 RepID=UPI00271F8C3A|nr:chemotaxis protein CheW [Pseudotabrizicola sp.]MDO9638355.1 chemotaxis protein CheW [Pseudotabrizicola sp.]